MSRLSKVLILLLCGVFLAKDSSVHGQDENSSAENLSDKNSSLELISSKPGRILGRVFDADTGEALKDVTVVLEDRNRETKTDLEGRYRLSEIAPGDYSLLFFKENYQRTRVKVEGVVSGRSKLVDLPLNPDYSNLETLDAFEITAEDLAGSDIQLLALRQESMVVMDAMGSFDMSRLGAGNVADALTKMVGTSVQDGKYVVVRGLADRYSNATFNGVPIPSSDVYRNTPQLDLFPSVAVDSISIKKSMSPELGAAFAGGSVDVVTKAYPEEFTLNISAGTKFNELLFDQGQYLTYDDGKDDQYGFGLDSRKLPDDYQKTAFWWSRSTNPSLEEKQTFMEGFDHNFLPKYKGADLGKSFGIEFGNLIEKKDFSLGVLFSFDFEQGYSSKPKIYEQSINDLSDGTYEIKGADSYLIEEGSESAELGSYFQTSFIPDENNELGLIVLWSHTGEKKARSSQNLWEGGLNGEPVAWSSSATSIPVVVQGTELSWEERDMLLPQIYGKHLLGNAEDWELNWRVAKTLVSLDEPERKTIARAWQFNPRTNLIEYLGPSQERSGADIEDRIPPTQIWRKMEDESTFYRLDFGSPTFELGTIEMELDFGLSKDQMEREFDETGFVLEPSKSTIYRWRNNIDESFAAAPTSEFKVPAPFEQPTSGLDTGNYLDFPDPRTVNVLSYISSDRASDYEGQIDNRSLYLSSTWSFPGDIKLLSGIRHEKFNMTVTPVPDKEWTTPGNYDGYVISPSDADNVLLGASYTKAEIRDSTFYPSFTISKDWREDIKASLSYGETTARPNFREIAYVESFDPIRQRKFLGNPSLVPSEIKNYDLRIDWSISETDILSASLFLKEIDKPIEATVGDPAFAKIHNGRTLSFTKGSDMFVNSDFAEVFGVELELKKGLGEFSEILNGFRIGGNLTWSHSEVQLSEEEISLIPGSSDPTSEEYSRYNVAERMNRALQGQSEWIYTIDLSYSNEDLGLVSTLVYSYYGDRLFQSAPLLPQDYWEDGFSNLDFINSYTFGTDNDWKIKFAAKNLTAEKRIIRVKDSSAINQQYETPRVYSLSLEKSF